MGQIVGARGRMEFHVSRSARDLYGFDLEFFSSTGNVVFANPFAARAFAARMNARRDAAAFPERAVRAADLNAMGLIDELLHALLERYRAEHHPTVMRDALAALDATHGEAAVDACLLAFAEARALLSLPAAA